MIIVVAVVVVVWVVAGVVRTFLPRLISDDSGVGSKATLLCTALTQRLPLLRKRRVMTCLLSVLLSLGAMKTAKLVGLLQQAYQ